MAGLFTDLLGTLRTSIKIAKATIDASAVSTAKTITLPDATDTLVGKATTDTLTNKTYDTVGTGNVFKINGVTVTTLVPVAQGGTNLASGTSGGILGYTATGTLASSALLTANGIVLGGGAGATPTSTAAMTNGQLLVGQTSAAPLPKTVSGYATMAESGALTVTKMQGTTTNDAAAAGDVGEFVNSTILIAGAVSTTNGAVTNITSISLTAGDWDVWGTPVFRFTGLGTAVVGAINTTSATFPAAGNQGYLLFQASFANATQQAFPVSVKRLSLPTTTTVYLIGEMDFSTGAASMYGSLSARRVR